MSTPSSKTVPVLAEGDGSQDATAWHGGKTHVQICRRMALFFGAKNAYVGYKLQFGGHRNCGFNNALSWISVCSRVFTENNFLVTKP